MATKKTASQATIMARFIGDEISRRKAIIDATAWAVWSGNRIMIEELMKFAATRNSNAVDLAVVNRIADNCGGSALQYWAMFKSCRDTAGMDATAKKVAAQYKALWDAERDNRKRQKQAAAYAAEQAAFVAMKPPVTGAPLRCSTEVVEVVEVVEAEFTKGDVLALPAPYKKPSTALLTGDVLFLSAETGVPAVAAKGKKRKGTKKAVDKPTTTA